jgi:hypothetical protein
METVQITENLAAIEGRSEIEQMPTVDLRLCLVCLTEMRDHDKFCRQCGARQTGAIALPPENTAQSAYATSRLQADTFNSSRRNDRLLICDIPRDFLQILHLRANRSVYQSSLRSLGTAFAVYNRL